jgi:ribosomal protein L34E
MRAPESTGVRRSPIACENMNHRRANSPVPHCPQCGEVVNGGLPRSECADQQHAVSRRQGSVFCVRCGTQLIVRRA